jgi:TRAP transporter TAXI family solute receptor
MKESSGMKRIMMGVAIVLVMFGFCVSVGQSQQKAMKRYSIATGGTSGVFYFVGAGIASITHQYLPEVEIVVESTSASPENARLVSRGMADFAMTTTEHSFTAYNGTGQYGKEEKGNIRFIRNSHIAYFQIVTNNPKINSVYDLKGKRVAFGAPGSTTYMSQGPALMKAHGMTYADVKPQALAYAEAIEAIKDGNLDATLIGAGIPTAAIIDLYSIDSKTHLIPVGEKEMKKMMEFDPYCFGWEVPPNTYKGQTKAVLQPAIAQIFTVNKSVPDDVVYNITKITDQNTKDLIMVHGVFKEWSHKSAGLGCKIPYHPGAEKYWKEKGVLK